MTIIKKKKKIAIDADQSKAWLDHLKKLVVQGYLLKLAHSEESDLTWHSAIYSLPRRVLSFVSPRQCAFVSGQRFTIPPEVLVTSSRPDLVIHYPDANVIKII